MNLLPKICAAAFCFSILAACATAVVKQKPPKTPAAKKLTSYTVDFSSPLADRIFPAPAFIVDYMADFDKKHGIYKSYQPAPAEMKRMRAVVNMLPSKYTDKVKDRFLGCYLIENFWGSGFAEWVKGPDGLMYSFIVINPVVLKKSASQWLTDKVRSCFKRDDPSYDLQITLSDTRSGFYFIYAHELAHAYDYINRITPGEYFDKKKPKAHEHAYTKGSWLFFKTPNPANDFTAQKKVTFYGLSKGPHFSISEAVRVYRQLEKTRFVTLYGSQNWMEDFAELSAAYVNRHIFKEKFSLVITHKGKKVYQIDDMLAKDSLRQKKEIVAGLY